MANKSFGLGNVTKEVGGALGKVLQYRMSERARQDALNMMQRKQQFERQLFMLGEQGKTKRKEADLAAQKEQTDALLRQREMQHDESLAARAAQTAIQGERLDIEKKRAAADNFKKFRYLDKVFFGEDIARIDNAISLEESQSELLGTNPDPIKLRLLELKRERIASGRTSAARQYFENGGLKSVLNNVKNTQSYSSEPPKDYALPSAGRLLDKAKGQEGQRRGLNEPPKTKSAQGMNKRERAIEYLKKNNKPVTDRNIQYLIDGM